MFFVLLTIVMNLRKRQNLFKLAKMVDWKTLTDTLPRQLIVTLYIY